jgi:hypothetical protein
MNKGRLSRIKSKIKIIWLRDSNRRQLLLKAHFLI